MANDQISKHCLKVKIISSNQDDFTKSKRFNSQQNQDYLFKVNKLGILIILNQYGLGLYLM